MARSDRDSLVDVARRILPPFLFSVAERKLADPSRPPRCWTLQRLGWVALFMALDEASTLDGRFENACRACLALHPRWKLGRSYSGFADALVRTPELVQIVMKACRDDTERISRVVSTPNERWRVVAVDGTRVEAPHAASNEAGLGCAGREKSAPQVMAATLWDVDLRLPLAFAVGGGKESERRLLDDLLPRLPDGALLVADAGFVSYSLCRRIVESGRHFLLRVGGNVHLIRGLGGDFEESGGDAEVRGGEVDLWPEKHRREPPFRLRLVRIESDAGPLFLATDVLDPQAFSDAEAAATYRLRWGEEVFHRDFKQTLSRGTLLSRTPEHCLAEIAFTIFATWILGLMATEEQVAAGVDPRRRSTASARDALRECVQRTVASSPRVRLRRRVYRRKKPTRRRGRGAGPRPSRVEFRTLPLRTALAWSREDDYIRRGSKESRSHPRKKRQKRPGPPQVQPPTAKQQKRYEQLKSADP